MKNVDPFIGVGDSFSDILEKKSADQISVEVSEMTLTEHLTFVAELFNRLEIDLEGEGMEVAAGAGVFACTLARLYPKINKIYAAEIVPGMVNKLQPILIEKTNMQGKVIPLVSDFNDIHLPNNSLDFIVGFNSFHHSNDLKKTLSEVGRVLKPGGKLVFFDRAHPNLLPKEQEDFLLNIQYGTKYKKDRGIPLDQSYTRRDNGEHEPRIRDWQEAILGTGIKLHTINIFSKRSLKALVKVVLSFVPFKIRAMFGKLQYLSIHKKMLFFYLCPPVAKSGFLRFFSVHTKFKTLASIQGMMKMVFIASKTN